MKWTAEEERDLMEIYTDGTDYSERHAFDKVPKLLAAKGYELRSGQALRAHINQIEKKGYVDEQPEEEEEEIEVTPKKGKAKGKSKGKKAAETPESSSRARWTEEEETALSKYHDRLTKSLGKKEVPDWDHIVRKMIDDGFPERSVVAARAHFYKM